MRPVDATRSRFARDPAALARLQRERARALEERVSAFVAPLGNERALDAGTGAGALALALAPLVREVVGVDVVPELLEEARREASQVGNVTFVEGDMTALVFADGSFDLTGCLRVLHHVEDAEPAITELARVTRVGGRVLVVDQIASADPRAALELNRFERARDASHARALTDAELRGLFEQNGLVARRVDIVAETRDLERYLDLAGCDGAARVRARSLARSAEVYTAEIGWYLLEKQASRA